MRNWKCRWFPATPCRERPRDRRKFPVQTESCRQNGSFRGLHSSLVGGGGEFGIGPPAVAGFSTLLHQLRNDASPPCLMACTDSRARVTMEVFVKQHVVTPVWIRLEFIQVAKYRPSAVLVLQKDARHAA